jgi:hypothetical protein
VVETAARTVFEAAELLDVSTAQTWYAWLPAVAPESLREVVDGDSWLSATPSRVTR